MVVFQKADGTLADPLMSRTSEKHPFLYFHFHTPRSPKCTTDWNDISLDMFHRQRIHEERKLTITVRRHVVILHKGFYFVDFMSKKLYRD